MVVRYGKQVRKAIHPPSFLGLGKHQPQRRRFLLLLFLPLLLLPLLLGALAPATVTTTAARRAGFLARRAVRLAGRLLAAAALVPPLARGFGAVVVEAEAGDGGGVRGDEFAVDAGADALLLGGHDAAPPRVDPADVAAELEHLVHAGVRRQLLPVVVGFVVVGFDLLDDLEAAEGNDRDAHADARRDQELRACEQREHGGSAAFHGEKRAGGHFRCDVANFGERQGYSRHCVGVLLQRGDNGCSGILEAVRFFQHQFDFSDKAFEFGFFV